VAATCFLIGCHELSETDVWWHLRAGQYIQGRGQLPDLDPFTFSSSDRAWIDLHWGFQVVLAWLYRLAGVPGIILMSSAAYAGAVLVAWASRRRDWPPWVCALLWLPALLVLTWRYMPRPEACSALLLSAYLGILFALDSRPRLAWALPPLQVVWVNVHALFIIGPILLAFYLLERGLAWFASRRQRRDRRGSADAAWWRHVGFASAAVLAACLLNPYFLRGALFPLELFHKVDEAGGIYKGYIGEFRTARNFVDRWTPSLALGFPSFRALLLLLFMLPVSFLVPAAWRAWRSAPPVATSARNKRAAAQDTSTGVRAWVGGCAAVFGLLLLEVVSLPAIDTPRWLAWGGQSVPLIILVGGAAVAMVMGRRCWQVAVLVGTGSVATASWLFCLPVTLLGTGSDVFSWLDRRTLADVAAGAAVIGLLAAAVAIALVLRFGGSLFRLLTVAAFSYLGLQAVRNVNLFALVAATVLSWNLGEFSAELAAARPRPRYRYRAAANAGVAGLLVLLIVAVVTDWYGTSMRLDQHFGLREKPFAYAHEAAGFCGRHGMPERAVVFTIAQSGVYIFHNGPLRKLFMDARLEVPTRKTFQEFVQLEQWLRDGDPRWDESLRALGDPAVLVENHEPWIAASFLAHPRWRCVYFDAVAAVFLPRGADELEALFPTVDFAALHFGRRGVAPGSPPGAAAVQAKALQDIAVGLLRIATGRHPAQGALLLGMDRAGEAVAEDPADGNSRVVLGNCQLLAVPNPAAAPPRLDEGWEPVASLRWAQATYAFRQAVAVVPEDFRAWKALCVSFQSRGFVDARRTAIEQLVRCRPQNAEDLDFLRAQMRFLRQARPVPALPGRTRDPVQAVLDLLGANRPQDAVAVAEVIQRENSAPWPRPVADRIAGAYMQLGRPADARRVWQGQAGGASGEPVSQCRLAETFLVEHDFEQAVRHYRAALAADPKCAEAWCGLALLYEQTGRASEAVQACSSGLRGGASGSQRLVLEAIREEVKAY
jgi:Flp pilus assembly protein TadD